MQNQRSSGTVSQSWNRCCSRGLRQITLTLFVLGLGRFRESRVTESTRCRYSSSTRGGVSMKGRQMTWDHEKIKKGMIHIRAFDPAVVSYCHERQHRRAAPRAAYTERDSGCSDVLGSTKGSVSSLGIRIFLTFGKFLDDDMLATHHPRWLRPETLRGKTKEKREAAPVLTCTVSSVLF